MCTVASIDKIIIKNSVRMSPFLPVPRVKVREYRTHSCGSLGQTLEDYRRTV